MRLFISYAHVDKYQVSQLVEVLREADYDPWFDHKLMPGMDWKAELLRAITVCDAFLYALTPESVASEWCQWEFAQAVQMGKPVIPVLMQAKTPLPDAISRYQYADFTEGPTPRSVARLLGGLRLVTVVLPRQDAPVAPQNPQGVPAQAASSSPSPFTGRGTGGGVDMPPDLSHILPPPFEWCEIPPGWVTLEDASDPLVYNPPGTKGGKFHVKCFWIAKYPITNAQYRVFENDEDGYVNPVWWNYSDEAMVWREGNSTPEDTAFDGSDLPRTNVSWYEAIAFCQWLDRKVKQWRKSGTLPPSRVMPYIITIPTEQQWQRGAQGDDGRSYPWGNQEPDKSWCNCHDSNVGKTTPVTQYPKGVSPYGVWDMAGNVWEWCLTTWSNDDFNEIEGHEARVLRGGSWYEYKQGLRVKSRNFYGPFNRIQDVGFRLVFRPLSL